MREWEKPAHPPKFKKKCNYETVLRIRIPELGSGAFLTPGSGGKKSGSGSEMNNVDHIF
jgi:hypothetical protein